MTIEDVLKNGDAYVGPTLGVSMLPMLKSGRDTIVVRPKNGRLAPRDVALYKRGDDYVLHRVIAVTEGGYLIRGDNCYSDERVKEEDILGVLTEYFRKNKRVPCDSKRYLRYVKRRIANYPRRKFFKKWEIRLKKFVKRLLRKDA